MNYWKLLWPYENLFSTYWMNIYLAHSWQMSSVIINRNKLTIVWEKKLQKQTRCIFTCLPACERFSLSFSKWSYSTVVVIVFVIRCRMESETFFISYLPSQDLWQFVLENFFFFFRKYFRFHLEFFSLFFFFVVWKRLSNKKKSIKFLKNHNSWGNKKIFAYLLWWCSQTIKVSTVLKLRFIKTIILIWFDYYCSYFSTMLILPLNHTIFPLIAL